MGCDTSRNSKNRLMTQPVRSPYSRTTHIPRFARSYDHSLCTACHSNRTTPHIFHHGADLIDHSSILGNPEFAFHRQHMYSASGSRQSSICYLPNMCFFTQAVRSSSPKKGGNDRQANLCLNTPRHVAQGNISIFLTTCRANAYMSIPPRAHIPNRRSMPIPFKWFVTDNTTQCCLISQTFWFRRLVRPIT
jgi:hypothetical protein